jgi:hypothetical protein
MRLREAAMKNIVVCADGTWNTPDDKEDGRPSPTNVCKLFNAVAGDDKDKYYHPGVGTSGNWWDRVAGGGVGQGLGQNVKSAYKWLATNYRKGDRIFLFGFSRGAYTVRSAGGMISQCGLLDLSVPGLKDDLIWAAVDRMFEHYRNPDNGKQPPSAPHGLSFHNSAPDGSGTKRTPIHFIGVWDTVGALGIPDDLALLNLIDDPARHSFHDTDLSTIVKNARHAVAIDELRQSFSPTLWTKVAGRKDVLQVWFPGVHSDVGGGYAQSDLSDGALIWMIEEAKACGLKIRPGVLKQLKSDPRGLLHDSLTGVFKELKTRPRYVPHFTAENPDLHLSALDRHSNPPLHQSSYWKTKVLTKKTDSHVVDIFARERWNATAVFLESGVTYQLTATGEWLDGSVKSGPKGSKDGKFEPSEIAHLVSSGLGKLEGLFGKITGNVEADFWWTRRREDFPWFALVGVIANGDGAGPGGGLADHETFLVGDGVTISPKRDGYLFCYANDAWHAYNNNRGSISLTIKRL